MTNKWSNIPASTKGLRTDGEARGPCVTVLEGKKIHVWPSKHKVLFLLHVFPYLFEPFNLFLKTLCYCTLFYPWNEPRMWYLIFPGAVFIYTPYLNNGTVNNQQLKNTGKIGIAMCTSQVDLSKLNYEAPAAHPPPPTPLAFVDGKC